MLNVSQIVLKQYGVDNINQNPKSGIGSWIEGFVFVLAVKCHC